MHGVAKVDREKPPPPKKNGGVVDAATNPSIKLRAQRNSGSHELIHL